MSAKNAEDLQRRLTALREEKARIDSAIEQLVAEIDALEAREQAQEKGAEVLEVEPAKGGSYVLQKVRCGKDTCHCAKAGGELHGPYWYFYYREDGKRKSKYIGKSKPISL